MTTPAYRPLQAAKEMRAMTTPIDTSTEAVEADFDDDIHRLVMRHCHSFMSMEEVRNFEREILALRPPPAPSPQDGETGELVKRLQRQAVLSDNDLEDDLCAAIGFFTAQQAEITSLRTKLANAEQRAENAEATVAVPSGESFLLSVIGDKVKLASFQDDAHRERAITDMAGWGIPLIRLSTREGRIVVDRDPSERSS